MPASRIVDVLIALLVAKLRRIRVRELIDEREFRPAANDGIGVHLLEAQSEPCSLRSRGTTSRPSASVTVSRPVVRLRVADHDVPTLCLGLAALLEHAVGLADSRGHSDQDAVVPTSHDSRAEHIVHDQIDELDPDEGTTTPPSP
jgi:hypothetical protein